MATEPKPDLSKYIFFITSSLLTSTILIKVIFKPIFISIFKTSTILMKVVIKFKRNPNHIHQHLKYLKYHLYLFLSYVSVSILLKDISIKLKIMSNKIPTRVRVSNIKITKTIFFLINIY